MVHGKIFLRQGSNKLPNKPSQASILSAVPLRPATSSTTLTLGSIPSYFPSPLIISTFLKFELDKPPDDSDELQDDFLFNSTSGKQQFTVHELFAAGRASLFPTHFRHDTRNQPPSRRFYVSKSTFIVSAKPDPPNLLDKHTLIRELVALQQHIHKLGFDLVIPPPLISPLYFLPITHCHFHPDQLQMNLILHIPIRLQRQTVSLLDLMSIPFKLHDPFCQLELAEDAGKY
ncbi:hypothetical protein Fcan01_15778 [Folsomia candida]|uniref:Uncharacterized protein n=1 Tax=Folsomia candida TaxID=158441 RepID=A0A226DXA5_FOLCA|nr:hypothetical protein Fcan01_15778 [Folsomia candida]